MPRHGFSAVLALAHPPPISGQSVAGAMLLRRFQAEGIECAWVNIGRPLFAARGAVAAGARGVRALWYAWRVSRAGHRLKQQPVIFYLQLGQSPLSMLRDLPMLLTAERAGWATVVHIHGGAFRAGFERAPAWLQRQVQHQLGRVACAIVLSESLRTLVAGLVPEERIAVVANGVDEEMRTSRVAWDEPNPLTVLYLSNLIESKGYVTFLRAALTSQQRGLSHRFLVAGARAERVQVDPHAFAQEHQLTNVEVLGPLSGSKKVAAFARSDVFVLPSNYPVEGQPIALLEAMHQGLVPITTTAGGIVDLVQDAVNGYLVAPDDPEAIIDALGRIAADPEAAQRMVLENHELANERFTERAHGDRMLELFDRVSIDAASHVL